VVYVLAITYNDHKAWSIQIGHCYRKWNI